MMGTWWSCRVKAFLDVSFEFMTNIQYTSGSVILYYYSSSTWDVISGKIHAVGTCMLICFAINAQSFSCKDMLASFRGWKKPGLKRPKWNRSWSHHFFLRTKVGLFGEPILPHMASPPTHKAAVSQWPLDPFFFCFLLLELLKLFLLFFLWIILFLWVRFSRVFYFWFLILNS